MAMRAIKMPTAPKEIQVLRRAIPPIISRIAFISSIIEKVYQCERTKST
jgi:hypothetical protein